MKKKVNKKTWLEKKLKNKSFREIFEVESLKLSIGEQLIQLRMKAGLTQAQVAKKAGTTPSAISRYENAQYDRYEVNTLRKLAQACGGLFKVTFELEDKAA